MDRADVHRREPAEDLLTEALAARFWMRAFSDSAAFSVNVKATIAFGRTPSASRSTTRWEMTSVLPEPAEAMICRCEPRCLTAARAAPVRVGAEPGIVRSVVARCPGLTHPFSELHRRRTTKLEWNSLRCAMHLHQAHGDDGRAAGRERLARGG
jgi:hypothetical protein